MNVLKFKGKKTCVMSSRGTSEMYAASVRYSGSALARPYSRIIQQLFCTAGSAVGKLHQLIHNRSTSRLILRRRNLIYRNRKLSGIVSALKDRQRKGKENIRASRGMETRDRSMRSILANKSMIVGFGDFTAVTIKNSVVWIL
jgi:hypothetical protein